MGSEYDDLKTLLTLYDPQMLRHGHNRLDGEDVFIVPSPGLGVWGLPHYIAGA